METLGAANTRGFTPTYKLSSINLTRSGPGAVQGRVVAVSAVSTEKGRVPAWTFLPYLSFRIKSLFAAGRRSTNV